MKDKILRYFRGSLVFRDRAFSAGTHGSIIGMDRFRLLDFIIRLDHLPFHLSAQEAKDFRAQVGHFIAEAISEKVARETQPEGNGEKMHELACAQMIGFKHGHDGYEFLSLIESMGMTAEEWSRIKEEESGLIVGDPAEIDAHFEELEDDDDD